MGDGFGESNLDKLIESMQPVLNEGNYVFISIRRSISTAETASSSGTEVQVQQQLQQVLLNNINLSKVVAVIAEKEGTTFIVSKAYADTIGLQYNSQVIMSWITLNIHSALDAVGFIAVISAALTKASISCNVVAGFYHDHLFVPVNNSQRAIQVLTELAKEKTISSSSSS